MFKFPGFRARARGTKSRARGSKRHVESPLSCPGVETEQKLTERESEIERLKLEAHHQRATLDELVQRSGEQTVSAVRRGSRKSVNVGRKAIGGLAHRLSGKSHARQDREPPPRAASTKEASSETPRAPPRRVKSMPTESSGDVEVTPSFVDLCATQAPRRRARASPAGASSDARTASPPTFVDLCSSPALAAAPATSFADVVLDVRALNVDGDGAK